MTNTRTITPQEREIDDWAHGADYGETRTFNGKTYKIVEAKFITPEQTTFQVLQRLMENLRK